MRPVCPAPANRYWPRSTPSTCCASRRANFFGEAPAPHKRNVATSWAFASSALRPPLARFTSSMASRRSTRARVTLNFGSARSFVVAVIGIVIINVVVVRGGADRQNLAHRRVGKLIVQPSGDPFRLRDLGDGPAGERGQPVATSDAVLGCQGGSATHERHVEHHAPPVDVLERPVLTPFLERQGPRLVKDVAHRPDVLARIFAKELPFFWIVARICALDAEQSDKPLAILPLARAAECARGALEVGRQVGDASLHHHVDDALWRQEGKSEGCIIPNVGIEARVPRGANPTALKDVAQIVWRVVPVQDRTVSLPVALRSVADGVGQNDGARRGVGGVAEGPVSFQVTQAGCLPIEPKVRLEHRAEISEGRVGGAAAVSPAFQVHIGIRRLVAAAVARPAAATLVLAPALALDRSGPSNRRLASSGSR